jgi:hypothetical protein
LDLLGFAGRIPGSGEPDCEEDEDAEEDAMSAGKKYMIGSFWHQTTRGLIWKFVYSTTKEVETGKKHGGCTFIWKKDLLKPASQREVGYSGSCPTERAGSAVRARGSRNTRGSRNIPTASLI